MSWCARLGPMPQRCRRYPYSAPACRPWRSGSLYRHWPCGTRGPDRVVDAGRNGNERAPEGLRCEQRFGVVHVFLRDCRCWRGRVELEVARPMPLTTCVSENGTELTSTAI